MRSITIDTRETVEFRPVTDEIRQIVKQSKIENGLCQIFVHHTTVAVTLNEQADPAVVQDIIERLDAVVPQVGRYRHMEGNSPAHIKTSLFGNSVSLLVSGGDIVLGKWQGVFFCEFDGPRRRRMFVKVIGD